MLLRCYSALTQRRRQRSVVVSLIFSSPVANDEISLKQRSAPRSVRHCMRCTGHLVVELSGKEVPCLDHSTTAPALDPEAWNSGASH